MSAGEDELRAAVIHGYREGQGAVASGGIYTDLPSIWPHYEANYRALIADLPPDATILDAGSGHGSFIAWLRVGGWTAAAGVDLSPGDVEFANAHLGPDVVALGDVQLFLAQRRGAYDAVVMKALLEHLPKASVIGVLDVAARALRPQGRLVVEVPNMDWLAAPHERYMDITHEIGFTMQSLRSVLTLRFGDVEIRGSVIGNPTRLQRLVRPAFVRLLRKGLYVLGEGADDVVFESRSLIAVARLPTTS